ncbi:MAG TPA: M23 family metallopeptidase [Deltaproteobacteria bacterium]|nr:M23 family metallopeptidase [Deltaproteobacteria bacterium]
MMKSRGPGRESGSHIAMVCCLLVFALFPGLHAHDHAEVLIPSHAAFEMRPPQSGEDSARLKKVLPWRGNDGDITWACPRCGARDNVSFIGSCMRCGYAEGNPDEYLLAPVGPACVTSGYSIGHRAVDFRVPEGTPVLAAGDGVVAEVIKNDRSKGNVLKISHGNGIDTLYGHLGEILVPLGGYVGMGEVVALSGNSGASTGPHLHFELHQDGEPDDPFCHLGPWQ